MATQQTASTPASLTQQVAGLSLGPAAEAVDVAFEIQKLLDCGLDKETTSICIALIENGVNPEARKEAISARSETGKGWGPPGRGRRFLDPPHPRLSLVALQALAEVVKRLRKQAAQAAAGQQRPQ